MQTSNSPVAVARTSRRAFTLIELLTVIAIIGILAAIIIPVTGKVRATAKKTVCASNLRQIGMATQAFALDNKDGLPGYEKITDNTGNYYGLGRSVSPRWWVEGGTPTRDLSAQLLPYFSAKVRSGSGSGIADIVVCPANSATVESLSATSPVASYMLSLKVRTISNTLVRPFAYNGKRSLAMREIASPRTAVSMFDFDTEFGTLIGTTLTGAPATSVHDNTHNVLYFDGHVASVAKAIDPHETL